HAAQRRVRVGLAHELAQALPHGERHRVQLLRIGERDGRDGAGAREQDLAAHAGLAPRSRAMAAEISGQNSSTTASVEIEPTSPFDQNTRRSPPAPIIDRRKASSARLPRTSASVNGASGMAIFLNT